jgi:hypothetical protein
MVESSVEQQIKDAVAAVQAHLDSLEVGTFFSPIEQVWSATSYSLADLEGSFDVICRPDEYYKTVDV